VYKFLTDKEAAIIIASLSFPNICPNNTKIKLFQNNKNLIEINNSIKYLI